MSDKRPIDTLREKDASELSLTDYLIGHDNGAPAGYRTQLGEIAARLVGPIADDLPSDAGFIDALISSILGPITTNANGSYIQLENGLQICWHRHTVEHDGNDRNLYGLWTFPHPFQGAAVIPAPTFPTSGSWYSSGLNLNSLVRPFFVASPSALTTGVYVWDNSSPFSAGQWIDLMVMAFGRWK